MRLGRLICAFVAGLALVVSACGGSSTSTSSSDGTSESSGSSDRATVAQYGYGPSNDADLQPDVVVVQGGPAAIRRASADGQTWTIDANADGASKLREGSVMFATSSAVGRVMAITDSGDTRVVTLEPVELTDVLRDGSINVDQDYDFANAVFQPVPALPGIQSDPTADDTGGIGTAAHVVRVPTIRLVARHAAGTDPSTLPLPLSKSISVPVGDYKIKAYSQTGKLGVNVQRDGPLKLGIDLAFPVEDFHISSAVNVSNGQVTKSGFIIEGVKGIEVRLSAGIGAAGIANSKLAIEVPIEVNAPIPPSPATAGLPVNVKLTYKLVIETALTGKNSTLFAGGEYGLDGPIGLSGGKILEPTFSVKKSVTDSIGGITLGPSGLVVAVKMKLLAGIGTPAATVGPYGTFTAAIGVTNGSSLGAALARLSRNKSRLEGRRRCRLVGLARGVRRAQSTPAQETQARQRHRNEQGDPAQS